MNTITIDLSSTPIAARPPGFTEGLTGHGETVRWQVLEDPSALGGRVIAETSRDTADYRFPLITDLSLKTSKCPFVSKRSMEWSTKLPD